MATDPNIQQLTIELGNLSRSLRDMVDSSSRVAAAQRTNWELQADHNEQLAAFTKSLKDGKKLSKEQEKQANAAIKLKKEELKLEREYKRLREIAVRDQNSSRVSEVRRQASASRADAAFARLRAAQLQTTQSSTELSTSFVGVTKRANFAGAALAMFGNALVAQGKQLLAQNKANGGVIEGTGGLLDSLTTQQTIALKLGLSGSEYAETAAANRQMINAMGGSKQALQELNPSLERLQILTGSFKDALELNMAAATDFAKKGVRPSQKAMDTYTNDLVQLSRQTGMGAKEAAAFYNELSSDVEFMDVLRSARADEREALLENQRTLVRHSITLGMSADQAKEAAKAMSKIAAAKPIDRLKQAARVRALGGAMGIAGADAAAQAITAGKRATPEQQKALQEFYNSAANAMDQSAAKGLGTEIFASTLLEKLDLEQYLGKGSPFSTSVAQTLVPAVGNLEAAYRDASKETSAQLIRQGALLVEQAKLLATGNHYAGVIATGIAAAVALLGGGALLGSAKAMIGRAAAGVGATGAAATAGTAAAGAGVGTAAAGGKLAAAAKTIGAGAVMGGVLYGVDGIAGKMGAGKDVVDKKQDDINWERMTAIEKAESGLGRTIEKVGEFLFLDNLANEARSRRIGVETKHLDAKPGVTPAANVQPLDAIQTAKNNAQLVEQSIKTAASSEEIKSATVSSAQRLTEQVKKLDTSNDFLKRIAEMTEKQVDLTERMLVATTMTEQERTNTAAKTALRRDNKFSSQYNYV